MSTDRYYLLPSSKVCSESCNYCEGLGFTLQDKSDLDTDRSLKKALSGGYNKIVIPCNLTSTNNIDQLLQKVRVKNLTPVLVLNSRYIHSGWDDCLQTWLDQGPIEYLILVDSADESFKDNVNFLTTKKWPISFWIVVKAGLSLNSSLDLIPRAFWPKTYIHAPYKLKAESPFLSTRQLYLVMKSLNSQKSAVLENKLSGLDVYDPRVSPNMELEPTIMPLIETKTYERAIDISVVIPTYNNRNYIVNTLRHLILQTYSKEKYEIIIVDDGSDDGTDEEVTQLLNLHKERLNAKYIYFPRPQKRKMGDSQFRAGIARNLGVKYSQGELLVFLDSDILTPNDYLMKLRELHREHDVVQTERLFLKQTVSDRDFKFNNVDVTKDTYIPEDGYWESFYREVKPWMEMKFAWKYVCTYGLSMSKDIFIKVGWFSKNYIFYGFEDTDLGYRLIKADYKLYKSDIQVLHLFHETNRSEYRNSAYLRHELLKKTAKIFFHNQLDPKIFEHMRSLIDEGLNIRDIAVKVKTKLFNRGIGRRRERV